MQFLKINSLKGGGVYFSLYVFSLHKNYNCILCGNNGISLNEFNFIIHTLINLFYNCKQFWIIYNFWADHNATNHYDLTNHDFNDHDFTNHDVTNHGLTNQDKIDHDFQL